jgi:hypothetical protein
MSSNDVRDENEHSFRIGTAKLLKKLVKTVEELCVNSISQSNEIAKLSALVTALSNKKPMHHQNLLTIHIKFVLCKNYLTICVPQCLQVSLKH